MPLSWSTPVLGPAAVALWRWDARRKLRWIAPHLRPGDRLLEIGSGPGSLLEALRGAGFEAAAVDVADSAFSGPMRPILFDGVTLPFGDDAFDAAILSTTLHHAHDPDRLLSEARRVAPVVLVIEDIYTSALQRRLTLLADSVTNLEFSGHPHNNRDDDGWRAAFAAAGLDVVQASRKPYLGLFLQALYVLRR